MQMVLIQLDGSERQIGKNLFPIIAVNQWDLIPIFGSIPLLKCLLVLLGKVSIKKYSNSHTILDFNYQKHDVQGFYYKIQISVSPDKNVISAQTLG